MKNHPRYLTPEAKAEELAAWERLKRGMPHDDGPGDKGLPDPDMFEWCDRLNAIPGVCTLQSCAGHSRVYDSQWVETNGHLWLWLGEAESRQFDAEAHRLAKEPVIERVSRIYHENGQEITSICFEGNNTGRLSESLSVIVAFFEGLQA